MTAPTQTQLDDFARRLRALETELAQLRAQSVAPAPPVIPAAPPVPPAPPAPAAAPVSPPVSPGLSWQIAFAQRLLEQGDVRGALKQLSHEQVRAYNARRIDDLRDILELARRARAASRGGTARSAERLVEDTEH